MSKLEKTALSTRQRMMSLRLNLIMQGALLLVLIAAAAYSRGDRRSVVIYSLACIVPVGFSLVYWLAWKRGEAVRASGAWTREWEAKETRRNYGLLGVVALVWIAGSVAALALS